MQEPLPISQRDQLNEAAGEIEIDIVEAWGKDRHPKSRPSSNWASNAAHPCLFFLWATREKWEDFSAHSDELLGIFKSGNELEDAVVGDLSAAGYQVSHQQVAFESRELDVRGRIDGYLYSDRLRDIVAGILGDAMPRRWFGVPMEIKGVHPNYYEECTSFRAMLNSSRSWVRKYPGQTLLYAHMDEVPQPIVAMVVRNKSSRETRVILEVVDDFSHELERISRNLKVVNKCIEVGSAPAPLDYSLTWCERCNAAPICPTAQNIKGGGMVSFENAGQAAAELREMLDLREESHEAYKAYGRADRKIRKMLEATNHWPDKVGSIETVICTPHIITITTGSRNNKAKEASTSIVNTRKYKRIGG